MKAWRSTRNGAMCEQGRLGRRRRNAAGGASRVIRQPEARARVQNKSGNGRVPSMRTASSAIGSRPSTLRMVGAT